MDNKASAENLFITVAENCVMIPAPVAAAVGLLLTPGVTVDMQTGGKIFIHTCEVPGLPYLPLLPSGSGVLRVNSRHIYNDAVKAHGIDCTRRYNIKHIRHEGVTTIMLTLNETWK